MNEVETKQEILQELNKLCCNKDMARISRSLQRVFFDFLRFQREGLPIDFDQIQDDYETILDTVHALSKIDNP